MRNWFLVISFWFLDKKISFKFTIFSLMYFMLLPRIWCRGRIPVCVRTRTGRHPPRVIWYFFSGFDESNPYLSL